MAAVTLYRCKKRSPASRNRFPENYHVVGESVIDDDLADHPDVACNIWGMVSSKNKAVHYAVTYVKKSPGNYQRMFLHSLAWKAKHGEKANGLVIDHANHDGLDNRIENLRLATRNQNCQNTRVKPNGKCKYRGVCDWFFRNRGIRSFAASVAPARKPKHLGSYPIIEEAAFAYDVGASLVYGEFASKNLDPDGIISVDRQQEIREKVESHLRQHGLLSEAI